MNTENLNSGPSKTPSLQDAILVHELLGKGYHQHQIASYLKMNQGRISEIKTGKRFPQAREIADKQGKLF
ncbi:hypothetical protein WH95_09165 [Kiloniella litopenaei]|uniref:Uncharacterized protein n=1 Tax=Kiloniella litopenaei TaxID=1549748 RepID=A0A0M2RB52_9PROT|nr:hypothetical protein [Kiloniella litopenaei]KKJ77210.1 hypothetical protein WH95_09165 [Kiloniella litopenaei]